MVAQDASGMAMMRIWGLGEVLPVLGSTAERLDSRQ